MSKNILLGILGVAVVTLAILILTLINYGVACEARLQENLESQSTPTVTRQWANT